MTILFIISLAVLLVLLIYQNKQGRKWISGLFSVKNTRLLFFIGLLILIAIFDPEINDQIKKIKQKLNP
jgi:multisubunit Na+/H+ antiporter MnhB subunit